MTPTSGEVMDLLQFEARFREVRLNNPVVYDAIQLENRGLSHEQCMKLAIIELSQRLPDLHTTS